MGQEYSQTEKKNLHREQTVQLDGRKLLTVTGVLDMDTCDEHSVNAKTELGMLTVEGDGLHVMRLSLEEGVLMLEGSIGALYYSDEQQKNAEGGFFARLFR